MEQDNAPREATTATQPGIAGATWPREWLVEIWSHSWPHPDCQVGTSLPSGAVPDVQVHVYQTAGPPGSTRGDGFTATINDEVVVVREGARRCRRIAQSGESWLRTEEKSR